MTVLDLSLDRPAALNLSGGSFDLSVVTIESLVARDISIYTERNRRTGSHHVPDRHADLVEPRS